MEAFRRWLLGVVACAMLVSLVGQLCPEGGVRRVARFTGGLLLLLAMLCPLAALRLPQEEPDTPDYRAAVMQREQELRGVREKAMMDGIAAQLEAYIGDKAKGLGVEVRAELTMGLRDGTPVPERVKLYGPYNDTLSAWITAELGLAKEKQEWSENG